MAATGLRDVYGDELRSVNASSTWQEWTQRQHIQCSSFCWTLFSILFFSIQLTLSHEILGKLYIRRCECVRCKYRREVERSSTRNRSIVHCIGIGCIYSTKRNKYNANCLRIVGIHRYAYKFCRRREVRMPARLRPQHTPTFEAHVIISYRSQRFLYFHRVASMFEFTQLESRKWVFSVAEDPIRGKQRKTFLFVCTRCEAVAFLLFAIKNSLSWVNFKLNDLWPSILFALRCIRAITRPREWENDNDGIRMTHASDRDEKLPSDWMRVERKINAQVIGVRLTNNKLMNFIEDQFWCTICCRNIKKAKVTQPVYRQVSSRIHKKSQHETNDWQERANSLS